MKRVIFIFLLCLAAMAGFSQGGWTRPNVSYGFRQYRIALDSTLFGPTGNGAPSIRGVDLHQYAQYFDSGAHVFWLYDPKRAAWDSVHVGASAVSGWGLLGNSGTVTGTNFLGTTDAQDLQLHTNSLQRFTINTSGAFGLGTGEDYGTSGYLLKTQGNGAPPTWLDPSTITIPINNLLGATAFNDINNGNLLQNWRWNTLGSNYGLLLSSNSTLASTNGQILFSSQLVGANANSSQSTFAGQFVNQHTGTGSVNIALDLQASGGANNYGLRIQDGSQSNGYILQSDATGRASWVNPSSIYTATPTWQQVLTAGNTTSLYPHAPGMLLDQTSDGTLTYTPNGGTDYVALRANDPTGSGDNTQTLQVRNGIIADTDQVFMLNGAQGDLPFYSAVNTISNLAKNTSGIRYLSNQGGAGHNPSWNQIDLSNGVTGTLPIANGGTNNGSLSVTAGTVYYGDGTKLVGLAPGTSSQILHSGTTPSWKDTTASSGISPSSGTLNYLPKWTPNGSTLGNSQIFDDGSKVGVNNASPDSTFTVTGSGRFSSNFKVGGTTTLVGATTAAAITASGLGTFNAGTTTTTAVASTSVTTPLLIGGTTSGGNLTLQSTSHATKGKILFGTSAYDEVNDRLGIGTSTPLYALNIVRGTVNGYYNPNSAAGKLYIGTVSNHPIGFAPNDAESMTLLTNGNVGIGTTSPNSTLHDNGSFATAYVAKTANYTASASDYTINFTSNADTLTLPTAVGITGRIYVVVNSGLTVFIQTTSSQTFANVIATPTTLSLSALGSSTFQSNGANWLKLN